ncbi:MAG: phosphate-starvation-inducible PsiE family protein [Ktedonobacteraceae bacterium]
MSDHQINLSEPTPTLATHSNNVNHKHNGHAITNPVIAISSRFLDQGDSFIYAVVGICFFIGAIFTLGYSFWDFGSTISQIDFSKLLIPLPGSVTHPVELATPQSVVANAIIKLVSDLLLVLIIMEVLGTVIHYLKAHATSLRPFLFIGIVSATRGILSIGARLSVKEVTGPAFYNAMIELAVSGGVILALGITLKLLGKLVED